MKKIHLWPRKKDNFGEAFKDPSPIRLPGTVWMVDLKKAGDRADYLCSGDRKKWGP